MSQRRQADAQQRQHLDVLDVVDGLAAIATLDRLVDALVTAFDPFAIDHFVITGLPHPHERFEKVMVLKHWPSEWFKVYAGRDFARHDPVIRQCRTTTSPFEWTEAPFDRDREPLAQIVMDSARDFGLLRGFSVPVHGLQGSESCFSVSGRAPILDRHSKPALHLIAMYAFERARRLSPSITRVEENPLTDREREVLTWAAVGKSHVEIAEILHVTERTITAHTVNATHKLGAANKTQAVVRAMQAKFIRI